MRDVHERVGVEVELGGLSGPAVARLVQEAWGGRIEPESDHLLRVRGTRYGDVKVELDTLFTPKVAHAPEPIRQWATDLLRTTEGIVPMEIAGPPMRPADLPAWDDLLARLAAAGGTGTADSMLAAFGVHLNPSLADTSVGALHRWMLAFALGFAWLEGRLGMDRTRRLLHVAEPYEEVYVEHLCRVDYGNDLAALIEDYIRANPTRSRALDMLPVFAHLDPERVASALPRGAKSPRPTLHYRLPDSRVGEPGWSIVEEWQRWLAIARLATDPARLDDLRRRFLESGVDSRSETWREISGPWFETDDR
ncbi:MAG: amidoligase family protein [Pseudomonadota bacterium]